MGLHEVYTGAKEWLEVSENFRSAVEARIAYYESLAQDREEFVFNGWLLYKHVKPEIQFFRRQAMAARRLLLLIG